MSSRFAHRRKEGFRRHMRAALLSAGAAFGGFLLLVVFVVLDVHPGGWPLVAFAVATPTLAALYAHWTPLRTVEVWGFTFACIVLEWPVLAFAALIVRYWITGETIGT